MIFLLVLLIILFLESGGGGKSGKDATGSNKSGEEEEEFQNKGRNLAISGIVAAAAMLGYAVASGLVQVRLPAFTCDSKFIL